MQKMRAGTPVWYVSGAGEEAVLGHFVKHNDDGTDSIQTQGGVENVPRREPAAGRYTPGQEDLGRTWHAIPDDD